MGQHDEHRRERVLPPPRQQLLPPVEPPAVRRLVRPVRKVPQSEPPRPHPETALTVSVLLNGDGSSPPRPSGSEVGSTKALWGSLIRGTPGVGSGVGLTRPSPLQWCLGLRVFGSRSAHGPGQGVGSRRSLVPLVDRPRSGESGPCCPRYVSGHSCRADNLSGVQVRGPRRPPPDRRAVCRLVGRSVGPVPVSTTPGRDCGRWRRVSCPRCWGLSLVTVSVNLESRVNRVLRPYRKSPVSGTQPSRLRVRVSSGRLPPPGGGGGVYRPGRWFDEGRPGPIGRLQEPTGVYEFPFPWGTADSDEEGDGSRTSPDSRRGHLTRTESFI